MILVVTPASSMRSRCTSDCAWSRARREHRQPSGAATRRVARSRPAGAGEIEDFIAPRLPAMAASGRCACHRAGRGCRPAWLEPGLTRRGLPPRDRRRRREDAGASASAAATAACTARGPDERRQACACAKRAGPRGCQPQGLQFEVRDDGIGLSADRAHAGRGLNNMRARAHRLGAELSITAGSPGTCLVLLLGGRSMS